MRNRLSPGWDEVIIVWEIKRCRGYKRLLESGKILSNSKLRLAEEEEDKDLFQAFVSE